jgi:hypothetical protein
MAASAALVVTRMQSIRPPSPLVLMGRIDAADRWSLQERLLMSVISLVVVLHRAIFPFRYPRVVAPRGLTFGQWQRLGACFAEHFGSHRERALVIRPVVFGGH